MAIPTQSLPTIGQPNTSEDPKIRSCLSELQSVLTGATDVTNLSTTTLQLLGLTNGAQIGRGKSIVATSEVRTNVAYGVLTTPDKVTGIVLPTDGLIFIAYRALWSESVAGSSRAAIFIGANQLKVPVFGSSSSIPGVQAATTIENTGGSLGAGIIRPLLSSPIGLISSYQVTTNHTEVTTGTAIAALAGKTLEPQIEIGGSLWTVMSNASGGPCVSYAAAGTYDISVQFKASSGNVTVSDRHLWVWTMSF